MKIDIVGIDENGVIVNDLIHKIREFINLKNLEPGDKLPSERSLSEKFNVTRNNIREAIHKLEYFGILKSIPQSGTFVADIGVTALNGMVDDIIKLKDADFRELVETRILLELKAVKFAARRRSETQLQQIKDALDAHKTKVLKGEAAVEEDLLFHLAIARASGNSMLITLMLIITPKIINNFNKYHVCDEDRSLLGIQEHSEIYEAIKNQNPVEARIKMKKHFSLLYQYCYNIKI